ncbi:MAG: acyl carrier protein [Candidatus Sumerlaeota bacterium]|nr:acyl carrier protein [Candidatus Sumerlaeota bacterium]
MEEFYGKLAEILEVDQVNGNDVLEEFSEWDSLSALSVIAMIDAQYGVNLTATDLRGIDTAQNLFALVIQKKGV